MKKFLIIVALALFGVGASGQNNHFPATGNVGIGINEPQAKLHVVGNILSNDPTSIEDWNTIWQSGFFEGHQKINAPEQHGWFWGINLNHGNNNPDYKYGGQVLIKNAPTAPIMYFRSRGRDGSGTWAKILHSVGNQRVNGDLTIDGVLKTEEVKVEVIAANSIIVSSNGHTADFVFEPDYNLRSLEEVENYIIENKHLPNIPSADQMNTDGVDLAEMNKLLLMKIEELTLYMIEQQKMFNELKESISKQ